MINKNTIVFPALSLDKKGVLELLHEFGSIQECSLLYIVKGMHYDVGVYDSDGYVWTVKRVVPSRKIYLVERMLCNIFWNPKIKVEIILNSPRQFDLDALKSEILRLIEMDDDIITQFVDAEELTNLVRQAREFDDLVAILKEKMVIGNDRVF